MRNDAVSATVNSQETGSQNHVPVIGIAAVLFVCICYAANLLFCQWSVLSYFPYLFTNSDMYSNLQWAKSILAQGWLNPHPYHPYTDWMQKVGTQQEWLHWWGGAATFQQAPLYAYFLSLCQWLSPNLIVAEVAQALLAVGLCALLGRLTYEVTQSRAAGWTAFGLAAAYSPFYAYSWTPLRDLLGWVITAALLLSLVRLQRKNWAETAGIRAGLITGLLLGLGFLARETFLLIAPVVLAFLAWQSWQRRQSRALAACFAGFCVCLAPLAVRNLVVGLPPLALSNRFADTFIQGHSARGHPYLYIVPDDMRSLMEQSEQGQMALVRATLKTHGGLWPLCRFELSKMLSLLDPYEPPDNLSIYYIAEFSPLVRFGLRHWMLLVPGLGGLIWTLVHRDRRHAWLWLLFPMMLAGVLVGVPVSRYRQTLAVFWIPWASCLLLWLFQERKDLRKVGAVSASLLVGWALCLGPFSRQPAAAYERPAEFQLSAFIYDQLGLTNEAAQVRATIREKFPGVQP